MLVALLLRALLLDGLGVMALVSTLVACVVGAFWLALRHRR